MPAFSRLRLPSVALAAAGLLLPLLGAQPASAETLIKTTPGCGVSVTKSTFLKGGIPFVEWRENEVFDGRGRLWVSNYTGNRIEAYDASGARVATIPVKGPGGLALAPSGRIEVNTSIVFGKGTVSSFDPDEAKPSLRVEVPEVSGHNGLALDGDGNRYVTSESGTVRKFFADGTPDAAWTAAAKVSGTNGAWVADGKLYLSRLSDLTSSVVELGLSDPAPKVLVRLSPELITWKGLDDLTVVGRYLYVTGFLSGSVMRVDRETGAACTLVSGLGLPTSVRAPMGFGGDSTRELFVTGANGAITRLALS